MKLQFVEVAGFRGFRKHVRFDFESGFAVLAGRNGVGKSTVFDAIDFALTGTINKYKVREAKGGGLEQHIWWVGDGAPEGQYVCVGFVDDEGEPLTVRRSRDRGLETPEAETGKRLCAGISHPADWPQMLMHTSLIRDETIADLSLDLTEQARFSAVQAAMGGLRGPDHSERIDAILKAANLAQKQQQERANSAQADLGRALGSLTEAQSIASNSPDIVAADRLVQPILGRTVPLSPDGISELRRMIADRKRSIGPLLEAATQLESVQEQIVYFASTQGQEEIRSKQAEVDQALTSRSAAAQQLQLIDSLYRAEREQDSLAFHLAALLEHGQAVGLVDGHCPLCEATRRQEQFAQALDALRLRLADRGERLQHISSDLHAAQAALDEADSMFQSAKATYDGLLSNRDNLTGQQRSAEAVFKSWNLSLPHSQSASPRESVLKRQEDTATLEQALSILETSTAADRVATIQIRVTNLRASSEAETTKLHQFTRAVECARQIQGAAKVVANELLAEQFETVLPLFKELYLRLRPHSEWQEIETDIGGHVRASLNFTVGEGRNPQFLFSSGQRRTAGIAFLLAIHLSRPWCKFRTLLLDDPVQHIDDYRALNLVEVLSSIRRTGRQVIIAVEDASLADLLCRRLRSTASDPGKRFDLAIDADGSSTIETQTPISPLPESIMEIARAS